MGFPGGTSSKEPAGDISGLNPWVGKIPWRRKWPPTPVFLPGKFHGQRSTVAIIHSMTKSQTRLCTHTHICTHTLQELHVILEFTDTSMPGRNYWKPSFK